MLPNSSDAADVNVGIEVNPFLSMTASPTVAMTTTPTQSGTVTTGDITTNISTNNATGYTLSLNAKTTNDTNLTHTNTTTKIPSTTNTAPATLAINTWGYNTKTGTTPTTFLSIPAPTTPAALATTTTPSTDSRTVTIAVKADTTIPAGAYKSTLTLTAVANYVPEPKIFIQDITTATCPTTRTRVNDARDDATYWIQKMPDGKCWMLTNLAYGGGGTNTYGDVKSISNNESYSYTDPYYMIPTGSNRTTGTTDPSTSTDGGAVNPQYGYLYNWCAAMGVQTGTAACADATTPLPDTSISICPSGWRLPTSNAGGEFQQLTDAIGATTNGTSGGTTGSTNLRTTWLAMYSGGWHNGFFGGQGDYGYYWSSTQRPSYPSYAYNLSFVSSIVYPSFNDYKRIEYAVRCIAV